MSALRTPTTSPIDTATVADAMHRGVITCAPESVSPTVAATMAANAVHAVVLLAQDRGSALVVTDLDVIRAALRDAADVTAAELAREPLATVVADAPLTQAIALMARREDAHMLVSEPGAGWPAGHALEPRRDGGARRARPRAAARLRPGPARPLVSATSLDATTVGAVMHPGVVTCSARRAAWSASRARWPTSASTAWPSSGPRAARRRRRALRVGLLSDMDVLHAVNRAGPDLTAGELAVTSPLALPEDAGLERAASLMVEHDATHVVVVDRAGTPAGVVSTLDVLRILAAG